jgi:hypothetical protein
MCVRDVAARMLETMIGMYCHLRRSRVPGGVLYIGYIYVVKL